MAEMCNGLLSVLIVVVLVCSVNAKSVGDRTTDVSEIDCETVRPFFKMRNISLPNDPKDVADDEGACGGGCCSAQTQAELRILARRDFASMLRHNARSLQGLLSTTATTLHDHMTELASQSENKTLRLFSQVYQRMAVLSREPIKKLYSDIKRYVSITKDATAGNSDEENDDGDAFASTHLDIKASVNRFFTELFPLVYHHAINPHLRDFSFDYKTCLREAITELQPFGDIPRQISQSTFKSLDATRVLLQAFTIGVEILNVTDTLLTDENGTAPNEACHSALLQMTYCSKCRGYSPQVKPCSGYCLNVLRGCLTQHVTELDSPWNDYVEAIERLVIAIKQHDNAAGVNADTVIRSLDTKISEAIMYAMENGPTLEKKVKQTCGHAKLSDKEDSLDVGLALVESGSNGIGEGSGKPHRLNGGGRIAATPPDTQLLHFLASVVKSRGFYATLADSLCQDEEFAETRDAIECWNGQRLGEYTKTVVDASLSMQKYNPEVQIEIGVTPVGGQAARLADKLRHVRQIVVSALGAAGLPESDSYMQGDAAEGSGSGHRVSHYSDDSDMDPHGSGSGEGSVEDVEAKTSPKYPPGVNVPVRKSAKDTTASSSTTTPLKIVCTISILFLWNIG